MLAAQSAVWQRRPGSAQARAFMPQCVCRERAGKRQGVSGLQGGGHGHGLCLCLCLCPHGALLHAHNPHTCCHHLHTHTSREGQSAQRQTKTQRIVTALAARAKRTATPTDAAAAAACCTRPPPRLQPPCRHHGQGTNAAAACQACAGGGAGQPAPCCGEATPPPAARRVQACALHTHGDASGARRACSLSPRPLQAVTFPLNSAPCAPVAWEVHTHQAAGGAQAAGHGSAAKVAAAHHGGAGAAPRGGPGGGAGALGALHEQASSIPTRFYRSRALCACPSGALQAAERQQQQKPGDQPQTVGTSGQQQPQQRRQQPAGKQCKGKGAFQAPAHAHDRVLGGCLLTHGPGVTRRVGRRPQR